MGLNATATTSVVLEMKHLTMPTVIILFVAHFAKRPPVVTA